MNGVPCECGSLDAYWSGDTLRIYLCDACRQAPARSRLPEHRGFRAAYLRGMSAHVNGDAIGACPYPDKRTPSGRLSWSRAYRNAWRDGWTAASMDRAQALITLRYASRRIR